MSNQENHQHERAGKPSRGNPVIMHSMQPKPGEGDREWAKRCVKELKISLARQAGLIGDEPEEGEEEGSSL